MEFKLTINCDNAAFHPYEDDSEIDRYEIEKCLESVRTKLIDYGRTSGNVVDSNGNTVGKFELSDNE